MLRQFQFWLKFYRHEVTLPKGLCVSVCVVNAHRRTHDSN
jgi:hypothetical protein